MDNRELMVLFLVGSAMLTSLLMVRDMVRANRRWVAEHPEVDRWHLGHVTPW